MIPPITFGDPNTATVVLDALILAGTYGPRTPALLDTIQAASDAADALTTCLAAGAQTAADNLGVLAACDAPGPDLADTERPAQTGGSAL